ncbi:MAG: hypothetical protein J5I93_08565 [Pirellulaceae bacterium]|nr:hypothetical protein [Pirellulaceae bacterium]
MNFFTWIREGVKQSVLLGVTDAIEHLGEPADGDPSRQKLLAFLREGAAPALPDVPERARKGQPRRLGRSLRDLETDPPAAS